MSFTLDLPQEEEAQFWQWAHTHGTAIERDAELIYRRSEALPFLLNLFTKASLLTRDVLDEMNTEDIGRGRYLLLLLQTMVALSNANGGRPYTFEELNRRSRLEDAITLYRLQVVSTGTAARIAQVSRSAFLDALGKAGVSAFQYSAEDVLAEVNAA